MISSSSVSISAGLPVEAVSLVVDFVVVRSRVVGRVVEVLVVCGRLVLGVMVVRDRAVAVVSGGFVRSEVSAAGAVG